MPNNKQAVLLIDFLKSKPMLGHIYTISMGGTALVTNPICIGFI